MPLVPLSGPAEVLMASLRAERVAQADAQLAIERFLHACAGLSGEARQIQFDSLLGVVDESPTGPACFLSVVCGALLELGATPGRMGTIVHQILGQLLPPASYLIRECQKREEAAIPPIRPMTGDEADEYELQLQAQLFEEVSAANPLAREAWDNLGAFWPACVAIYSRDVVARVKAREYMPLVHTLAERHEGGHWLRKLLPVLDNEPLVVIDPSRSTGIVARMSGVADNFQLHTLLMHYFPRRWYERQRVCETAVAVATGHGPQQAPEVITGSWNLYQAAALGPHGRIARAQRTHARHWIWGEGVPTDLSIVGSHRVVLLGSVSHVRTWPSARLFGSLKAGLHDVQRLDQAGVRAWLRQLVAALPKPQGITEPEKP